MIKKLVKKGRNFINFLFAYLDNRKHRNKIRNKPVEGVFTYIYESNYWGDPESASGAGSNEDQTREIVQEIPKLFKKYGIKSVLDVPCGDFNWMRKIDLGGIRYIGGDIVEDIVAKNKQRYEKENITFRKLNLITDTLPDSDLLICRDCFIHLSNEQVQESLANIRKQKIRYLLTTSHTQRSRNKNIAAGEWRPINLEIEPFNLKPVAVINEHCTEDEGRRADKSLILIDLGK